jgi:hypothetical protein
VVVLATCFPSPATTASTSFSDRSERIFGQAPTDRFLDGFTFSPANLPNAALIAGADGVDQDVAVREPGDVRQQTAALPETFGRAGLFIDDCANNRDCAVAEGADFGPRYTGVGMFAGEACGTCWSW